MTNQRSWRARIAVTAMGMGGALWVHACTNQAQDGETRPSSRHSRRSPSRGALATRRALLVPRRRRWPPIGWRMFSTRRRPATATSTRPSPSPPRSRPPRPWRSTSRIRTTATSPARGAPGPTRGRSRRRRSPASTAACSRSAPRNSDDTFTLKGVHASSGSPTKLSTYDSVGDSAVAKVADLAIARVPVNNSGNTSSTADSTTDTKIIKLVVTAATTSGRPADQRLRRRQVDAGHHPSDHGRLLVAATKVAVAVPGRPQGMFVTGTLDGSGRVFAVNWQINDSGQLIERSIVQVPASGNYTDVTGRRCRLPARGHLRQQQPLGDPGDLRHHGAVGFSTMAMRSSFSDSNPIQGAKLVSGGSSRLFLVGRRGTAQVVRSYLATTTKCRTWTRRRTRRSARRPAPSRLPCWRTAGSSRPASPATPSA